MIRRTILFGAPALAAALLLATPSASQAQRYGGRSGGYYGRGQGWSGYNNSGYSYGWGGFADRPMFGNSYSNPGYSTNSNYYNNGWSATPNYYSGYSDMAPSGNYYSAAPQASGYQSFYPSASNSDRVSYVRLQVPDNAEVWIEGQKTQQGGTDRLYVSPPLDPNKKYTYDVRVRWMDANGREVSRTRQLPVRSGQEANASFMSTTADETQNGTTDPAAPTTREDQGSRSNNPSNATDRDQNTIPAAPGTQSLPSDVNRPATPGSRRTPGTPGRPDTSPPKTTTTPPG